MLHLLSVETFARESVASQEARSYYPGILSEGKDVYGVKPLVLFSICLLDLLVNDWLESSHPIRVGLHIVFQLEYSLWSYLGSFIW